MPQTAPKAAMLLYTLMMLWLLTHIRQPTTPLHTLCTSVLCCMLLYVTTAQREGLLADVSMSDVLVCTGSSPACSSEGHGGRWGVASPCYLRQPPWPGLLQIHALCSDCCWPDYQAESRHRVHILHLSAQKSCQYFNFPLSVSCHRLLSIQC